MNKFLRFVFVQASVLCLLSRHPAAFAQPAMPVPEPSPGASVSQTIGISDITVNYHRPGVKNRTIWGGLVPYGVVWRAGANENTTVSFSDSVNVEGKPLPPGTYGLHMIPGKESWTVIFSKNSTSWGSFFYDEKEDDLRVQVKPEPSQFQEWLVYTFDDLTPQSVNLSLRWEKLRVPVHMDIDVNPIVLDRAKNSYLRGIAGFTWQGFSQAAAYCLKNHVEEAEGLTWIERSIAMNKNFNNLAIKAGLLDGLGRSGEADEARRGASTLAVTEVQVNLLGYQYLGLGDTKDAVTVFKRNVAEHPDSWNVYDSLGEAQDQAGEKAAATENYTKALKLVQDEANKKRITGILQRLQGK